MIKIEINTEGHIYITRGTCRLFIHRGSPRVGSSSFLSLLRPACFTAIGGPGVTSYQETPDTAYAFINLRLVIQRLYDGHTQGYGPVGVRDTVNVIVYDCVSRTQELVRDSVLA